MKKKEDISKSFEALNRETLIIKKMLSGKITSDERAFFEEEIENDPFLREALEGLNQYKSNSEASDSITRLSEKISEKTGYQPSVFKSSSLNRPMLMAIAASALILVVAVWALVRSPFFEDSLPRQGQVAEVIEDDLLNKNKASDELISDSSKTITETDSTLALTILDSSVSPYSDSLIIEPALVEDNEPKIENSRELAENASNLDVAADGNTNAIELDEEEVSSQYGAKTQPSEEEKDIAKKKALETTTTREEITETTVGDYSATKSDSGIPASTQGLANAVAKYPGGTTAMKSFIASKTKYPNKLEEDISGVVRVSATIDEKGRIKNVNISKSVHYALDREALRVVKSMPRWESAIVNGSAVEQKVVIEVPFQKP